MKSFFSILISIMLLADANAAQFDKKTIPTKNILEEGRISAITSESGLQPIRARSLEMIRVMVGTPINTKGIGPEVQAEWQTRLSHQNPLFASVGIGYLIETKQNTMGADRNFHQMPISINAGYSTRLAKSWKASLAAGPVLRQVFERGNAREQNRSYSYGDLIASLGVDYEWLNTVRNSGQSVGLRASRMFGLANNPNAAPIDSVLVGFAFDL